jgi:hypothetical protein
MVGPDMLGCRAINYEQFLGVYTKAGQPLTEEQVGILTEWQRCPGGDHPGERLLPAEFLALGLTNQNQILTKGPLMAGERRRLAVRFP